MAGERGVSLVQQDVMDKAIYAGTIEELISLLVRLDLDILAQVPSSSFFVGHHHLIYGLRWGGLHLKELPGDGAEDGLYLEEPVC